MSQTVYGLNISAGKVGGKYDLAFDDVKSAFSAVPQGVGLLIVKDPAAADSIFMSPNLAAQITGAFEKGIVLSEHTTEQPFPQGSARPAVPAKKAISMCRKGRTWVIAEDVITVGASTVNVRFGANGANTELGSFRGAADGAFTGVLPGARWITSTTAAGQLAVLEYDL